MNHFRFAIGLAGSCLAFACIGPEEGQPPAATDAVSVMTAAARKKQVNDSCDPATEGWQPEAVPVSSEMKEKIKNGDPVAIPIPSGYQEFPPPGTPYCEKRPKGHYWSVRCDTDADCPSGSLCPVDHANMKCAMMCAEDEDCAASTVCRAGDDTKKARLCVCGPPDWCGDKEDLSM
jgi:hypothetical protein